MPTRKQYDTGLSLNNLDYMNPLAATKISSMPLASPFTELAWSLAQPSWMARAACKGQGELFYGSHECDDVCDRTGCQGERREVGRQQRIAEAKRLCSQCPVFMECAEWAETVALPYAIAAGLTWQERRKRKRM